jgi:hypothetical protein
MSDRAERTNEGENEPLFQNMEEQERTYAPEQLPDSDIPPVEQDRGGTAAEGAAAEADETGQGVASLVPGRPARSG